MTDQTAQYPDETIAASIDWNPTCLPGQEQVTIVRQIREFLARGLAAAGLLRTEPSAASELDDAAEQISAQGQQLNEMGDALADLKARIDKAIGECDRAEWSREVSSPECHAWVTAVRKALASPAPSQPEPAQPKPGDRVRHYKLKHREGTVSGDRPQSPKAIYVRWDDNPNRKLPMLISAVEVIESTPPQDETTEWTPKHGDQVTGRHKGEWITGPYAGELSDGRPIIGPQRHVGSVCDAGSLRPVRDIEEDQTDA
ncbi:hypothetical protein [Prauserella endophytica]|uniref:Uncharacterized protein n=1 Tax=Prauserella endophytica TaxID=1592324 RepID=A0ABY2S1U2_9PSEU|nr:hypothetical protein [Prauserella endophytica]TKG67043.1 hypothetical protein FCN18_24365 [Prauserella endophytica]